MIAPLSLYIWSKNRIVPVRLTDLSITEEAFEPALNPIRAKVSLGMRVLSVNDLGFNVKGGSLFMAYQQQKEKLAAQSASGGLRPLLIVGITRPRHYTLFYQRRPSQAFSPPPTVRLESQPGSSLPRMC